MCAEKEIALCIAPNARSESMKSVKEFCKIRPGPRRASLTAKGEGVRCEWVPKQWQMGSASFSSKIHHFTVL